MSVTRPTNRDLAEAINRVDDKVSAMGPRLERIEDLSKKAGLNGFSEDIHSFFEQRAESAVARQWLGRRLKPLAKFKYLFAVAGFISTVGWGILAIHQISTLILIPR